MKVTILYDNTAWDKRLIPDWGFACLVETQGLNILFDTGATGYILLFNMTALGISPSSVDMVFISHDHWDHSGGLTPFLERNRSDVYLPATFQPVGINAKRISHHCTIEKGVYSTGELEDIEQSLVVKESDKVAVIAGCSHPGVDTILKAADGIGNVKTFIGGLHDFNDISRLETLDTVCPTHCTRHIEKIKTIYPDKYVQGGAGKIIKV